MAIRTLLAVGLLALVVGSGCVGISGQRYYAENGKKSRGLSEIVDCPTCPTGHATHEAVAHAGPGAHGDGVIAPHAKFHPVPTRPVFAPKVVQASATVDVQPSPLPPVAAAAKPAAPVDSDEAPAPPVSLAVAKPSSRSTHTLSEPRRLSEDTMASVLVASKTSQPTLADEADAAPQPTPATKPTLVTASTPTKASTTKSVLTKTTTKATTKTTTSAGDGWRPRVAN